MTKAGERLLKSARKARAFARGETAEGFVVHAPDTVDVKAVRAKLDLDDPSRQRRRRKSSTEKPASLSTLAAKPRPRSRPG